MTANLESQVIPAPWQTIPLMVPPTDQTYDLSRCFRASRVPTMCTLILLLLKIFSPWHCVLDEVFEALTNSHTGKLIFTPCVIPENKSLPNAHCNEKQIVAPANWLSGTCTLKNTLRLLAAMKLF